MFIPARSADEAHFLCALLNSAPIRLTVAAYTTNTGMSTHVASVIALPRFSKSNPLHRQLADLSRRCHTAVEDDNAASLSRDETFIDEQVAALFSISADELSMAAATLA
jgi:hypothetical protein